MANDGRSSKDADIIGIIVIGLHEVQVAILEGMARGNHAIGNAGAIAAKAVTGTLGVISIGIGLAMDGLAGGLKAAASVAVGIGGTALGTALTGNPVVRPDSASELLGHLIEAVVAPWVPS